MGVSCCKLLVSRPAEGSLEEVTAVQEQTPGANILLQSVPPRALAVSKRPQFQGTPAVVKQACLRDLVAAQLAEKKAGAWADIVHGLGLTMRLSTTCKATSLKNGGEVAGLVFSPDGRNLLVGGEDGMVALWEVRTGTKRIAAKVRGEVTCVSFSPDGQFFAAGDETSRCTLWRSATLDEVGVLAPDEGRVLSVALGSWPKPVLAASFASGTVVLASVPDLKEMARLKPSGLLHGICFSPEGGLLAGGCGAEDTYGIVTRKSQGRHFKAVLCWRLPCERGGSCEELATLPFQGNVHATAFSPSGRLLAAGSEDRTARTFLVDRGFEQVSCLACPAGVWCLAWTADSRFLASGGEDMQVSVWDLIRERIVLQLPRTEDWICAIAISPNGDWLASSGFDGGDVALHAVEISKVGASAAVQQQGGDTAGDERKPLLLSGRCAGGVDILVSQPAAGKGKGRPLPRSL